MPCVSLACITKFINNLDKDVSVHGVGCMYDYVMCVYVCVAYLIHTHMAFKKSQKIPLHSTTNHQAR